MESIRGTVPGKAATFAVANRRDEYPLFWLAVELQPPAGEHGAGLCPSRRAGSNHAAALLWLLDSGNNIITEPHRAYVADRLTPDLRTVAGRRVDVAWCGGDLAGWEQAQDRGRLGNSAPNLHEMSYYGCK